MLYICLSDVADGLCNGATGELMGIEEHKDGRIFKLIVKFDNPMTGVEARENYPAVQRKYPGGTVVCAKEVEYSLSKTKSVVSSTAKLIQFPLIAAFAITGISLYLLNN